MMSIWHAAVAVVVMVAVAVAIFYFCLLCLLASESRHPDGVASKLPLRQP